MTKFYLLGAISTLSLALIGCSEERIAEETPTHETYSAEQFFQTTSYRMGSAGPYAFSFINNDLLVSSDQTGVYNAYRLDISNGELKTLTQSSDRGVYVESWFPTDDRFIYQQDGNGDELTHVFVMSPEGDVTDLTPGEGHKAL